MRIFGKIKGIFVHERVVIHEEIAALEAAAPKQKDNRRHLTEIEPKEAFQKAMTFKMVFEE